MKYLVFDTETNGFPFETLDLHSPQQPNIVQLSAILFDENGTTIEEMDTLIKPNGWEIDFEYELVHGWSIDDCEFMGIDIGQALSDFNVLCEKADILIAHHIAFDLQMLEIEASKNNFERLSWRKLNHFCTMKESTNLCKIPFKGNTYKYPSLEEAYKIIVGLNIDEDLQHNAHYDAVKTKDLFLSLISRNH